LILHLTPLWVFPFFFSADGAVHVETADIVRHYGNPGRALFRTYYVLTREPAPNRLGHWLLCALLSVARPALAEKLLLAGYVILLPLSVRYALRSVDSRAGALAVLAFPFVFNWPLHMGFYNFCLSLPLFFLTVGYCVRCRFRFSRGGLAVLAGSGILLYFAHIVGLVMAVAVVAIVGSWSLALDAAFAGQSRDWSERARDVLRPLATTAIGLLPALALTAWFLLRPRERPATVLPIATLWRRLRDMDSLVSFEHAETLLGGLVFWGFVAVSAAIMIGRNARLRPRAGDGFLIAAAACAVIYFVAPPALSGGAYLNERLQLFPFFALVLWFGTHRFQPWAIRALETAAVAVAAAWVAIHCGQYAAFAPYLGEYLSTEAHIEPGATLLPLRYGAERLSPRVDILVHAAGYLAANNHLVELLNYQAHKPHFPLAFRPGLDPYSMGQPENDPPCLDVRSYNERTGLAIDYVLLWGFRGRELGGECARSIRRALRERYDLVFVSGPRGLAKLYRRRDWARPTTAAPGTISAEPES
jgi:hypothetical protein